MPDTKSLERAERYAWNQMDAEYQRNLHEEPRQLRYYKIVTESDPGKVESDPIFQKLYDDWMAAYTDLINHLRERA